MTMHIGERWAYREPPLRPGKPFVPVEVLQFGPPKSKKARIRLLDGEYAGLDQWVPKGRLTVPWQEAEPFLTDEVRYDAVVRASRHVFGTPECDAAWMVFYAYPHPDGILIGWSSEDAGSIAIDDPEGVCADLGLTVEELLAVPLAYLDRHGGYVGPWTMAPRLAERVARRYPQPLLEHVRREEKEIEEWATSGKEVQWSRRDRPFHVPAEHYAQERRKKQPVFEQVRAWLWGGTGGGVQ